MLGQRSKLIHAYTVISCGMEHALVFFNLCLEWRTLSHHIDPNFTLQLHHSRTLVYIGIQNVNIYFLLTTNCSSVYLFGIIIGAFILNYFNWHVQDESCLSMFIFMYSSINQQWFKICFFFNLSTHLDYPHYVTLYCIYVICVILYNVGKMMFLRSYLLIIINVANNHGLRLDN